MNLAPHDFAVLMAVQEQMLKLPQADVRTDHVLENGLYSRTICMAPEVILIGALVKIPTLLIVSGETAVYTGDGWVELKGYHVIPAQAGRKQVFLSRKETWITMIFRTDAKTIEEAEEEFTDEYQSLMSRREN